MCYNQLREEALVMSEFKYLSPEWAQEATKRLKEQLTPERMKHLTSSMLTVYTNCPDGQDRAVYYQITDGIVDAVTLYDETLPQAEFTITGDYETFAQISRSELKARAALMSGKMTLKGNLVKALRLAPVVDRLNEVLATIPAEY
jgi:putative sterol carrier protein